MISFSDLDDLGQWPLFGGQLQNVLEQENSHLGDVQYGSKLSTGLVKPLSLAISYNVTDQEWPSDFDDIFGNSLDWTETLPTEQNNSVIYDMVPTLPSSPELPITPEFNVQLSSFNLDCSSFGDFNILQYPEFLNEEAKVPALPSNFVDFDSQILQDPDTVLKLLQVLGSTESFDQSNKIAPEPILVQMPPEDVESFLSISPTSTESGSEEYVLDSSPSITDVLYDGDCQSPGSSSSCGSVKSDWSHGSRVRAEPYSKEMKPERKQRKKEQNKTAALKYRQKKREEQGSFISEVDELQKKNVELKTRVDEITREINYLKGLLAEINSVD